MLSNLFLARVARSQRTKKNGGDPGSPPLAENGMATPPCRWFAENRPSFLRSVCLLAQERGNIQPVTLGFLRLGRFGHGARGRRCRRWLQVIHGQVVRAGP